jgi:DNA repair protein RadC
MGSLIATAGYRGAPSAHAGNRNGSARIRTDEVGPDILCLDGRANRLDKQSQKRPNWRQYAALAQLVSAIAPNEADRITERLLSAFGSLGAILGAPAKTLARHVDNEALVAVLSLARATVVEGMHEDVRRRVFDPADTRILNYLIASMQGKTEEHLHAIFLDSLRRYIVDEHIASGSRTQVVLRLRPLLRRAIEHNCAQLVLFHNHPSGDAEPSAADVEFTKEVHSVAKTLGIELLDHLIIAGPSVFSMRLAGLLA